MERIPPAVMVTAPSTCMVPPVRNTVLSRVRSPIMIVPPASAVRPVAAAPDWTMIWSNRFCTAAPTVWPLWAVLTKQSVISRFLSLQMP